VAEPVIKIENLGKRYALFRDQERGHHGLRHVLQNALSAPFRPRKPKREAFWALRNVSFEVQRGEVLGIVGRNGAGKSTLLKVLSRITPPTEGRIRLRGRIGSLLEVGTGFHPDLSGRENIYLNGAILGMRRTEIQRKFDEIVAFAEVEQFLDTPVKRYSSGMYVRLAFAVAAHLEPDILIIDEVLAVGDAQFQKKCLGKMEEVSQTQGRTILFVSHNMGAVSQLCNRALLLDRGEVVAHDGVEMVVAKYLNSGATAGSRQLTIDETTRKKKVFFRSVTLLNHLNQPALDLDVRFPFSVEMDYEVPSPLRRIELTARILTADGRAVLTTLQSELTPETLDEEKQGAYRARIKFPGMFFMPGSYLLNVSAQEPLGEQFDLHESVLSFVIRDTGTVFSKYPHHTSLGVIMASLPWENESCKGKP
jgi:lipopolysaccharide transport system ATP-binding protein